jgi:ATP-dependent Clp protease ATP-binding subunit ClpA
MQRKLEFNHNYIGTEHLLLGLVREGEGVAAKILSNLGIELNRVRSAVEFMIGRGDRMLVGEIGLTPRAKKVIELAVDEARQLGHHYIGTEHLLLGLIREGEGVAAKVLDSLGVNLEKVRTQTIQVLSQSGGTHGQTIQSLSQSSTTHEWRNVPAGTPTSGPQSLEYGTEQALQLLRQRRWEYCLAQVAYPDPGESGVVRWVQGGGDEGRFGRDTTPIHQALQALGAEGWELVAIDTVPRESDSSGATYALKRPL